MLASYMFFLTQVNAPCAAAGTGSTGWRTLSSSGKPWTGTRRTPQPASAATPRPLRSPAAAHSGHRAWLPCFVHHRPFGKIF